MKAMIVDLQGDFAAAFAEDGTIVKIPDSNYEIGQEIFIYKAQSAVKEPAVKRRFAAIPKRIASIAAAVASVLAACTVTAYAMPYGTVSVDSTPAVTYTINCFDYVLDVEAADEGSEEILSGLDMKELRHHRVDKAIESTAEQIAEKGLMEDAPCEFSITADTHDESHTEKLQRELDDMITDKTMPGISEDAPGEPVPDDFAGQDMPQENGPQGEHTDDSMPAPGQLSGDDFMLDPGSEAFGFDPF